MSRHLIKLLICIFGLIALNNVNGADQSKIHVASPDWREQIIYFIMIDRFNDGNSNNNNQGMNEYNPKDARKFSGGDLLGIEQKISYIKNLGATAVWITPPVANQWWSESSNYGGYHGYWAENLIAVDKHFGTLSEYQNLSKALHQENMYLIQDIVVNHMGNYFSYQQGWDKTNPEAFFSLTPDSGQGTAPSQLPFNQNNAKNPLQRNMGIYHWTPNISNYTDPVQQFDYQMAGLDDLNTENPIVRKALRESYAYWIKAVGVDAFRVDTAFYVPPNYFRDFLYSNDSLSPGVLEAAKVTGRENFHVFGEGFAIDKPYEDSQSKNIQGYMRSKDGQALMPGMLNFPLYGAISDVFARGHATSELSYRINNMMQLFEQPHLMVSFIDNHDVDRYLVYGNKNGLKQSLLLMMTLPGIPVIYYGTEQGLKERRASLFKTGFGANHQDHFNTDSEMYRYIQAISQLRKQNKVFTHGKPTIIKDNSSSAGAFAYRMDLANQNAFVLFNSAEHASLLDNIETNLPAGTKLQVLFSIHAFNQDLVVGENGRLSLSMPARSGLVLQATGTQIVTENSDPPQINSTLPSKLSDDFLITGTANKAFQLIIDGDLSRALTIKPGNNGTWQTLIDTQSMIDPTIKHTIVAWQPDTSTASKPLHFTIEKQWQPIISIDDPLGDDNGPTGQYQYPLDSGWRDNRQQDIKKISIATAGNNLKLSLTMHSITQLWNPSNGFDHVAFTAFIQVPGKAGGARLMPLQNANLPNDMQWHYRWRAHGWTNALFSSKNASDTSEGTIQNVAAQITVIPEKQAIEVTFTGHAIGNLKSLSGVKLYINTWDYDSIYRPLNIKADSNTYGGGSPNDPKIMDDTIVITLP